jgi:RNA polymerase sigma-70 factor (ECF subfamily)
MKFSPQNSMALPAPAEKTAAEFPRKLGGDPNSVQAIGAGILDAMAELGSNKRHRAEFEREIKTHLDSTMRIAVRLTGNHDLAEELVQETMLRAVRNWESFRHQSQFKTWLYRILINVFRDQLRRKPKINFADLENQNCQSTEATAESKAQANELGDLVAGLILQLPQRQREVLVLATYESLSNEQIASTLNINVANVHANLCTARKKLKQQLSKYLS